MVYRARRIVADRMEAHLLLSPICVSPIYRPETVRWRMLPKKDGVLRAAPGPYCSIVVA